MKLAERLQQTGSRHHGMAEQGRARRCAPHRPGDAGGLVRAAVCPSAR